MSIFREENTTNIERLCDAIRMHRVVPFVGAGLSQPYGHQGWPQFLSAMGRQSSIPMEIETLVSTGDYSKAAESLRHDLGRLVFEDQLAVAFGPKTTVVPDGITAADFLPALCYIPHLQRCAPVVTTNFDRVLKRVFDASGQPFEAEVWGARAYSFQRALTDNEPFLLKIHGDVLDPTDRVFTLSEYEAKYTNGGIAGLLSYLFSHRSVLFLGCSLEQDRVMEILEQQSSAPYSHFAFLEQPAIAEEWAARRRFLSNHNIRPIWYDRGEHHQINALLEHAISATTTEPHMAELIRARITAQPGKGDLAEAEALVHSLHMVRAQRIPYPPKSALELASARVELGSRLMSAGDFSSAVRELEQAALVLPPSAVLHRTLATALVGRGEFDRALREIAEAERLGAPVADMMMLRGLTYLAQQDFKQVRRQITLAMEHGLDPGLGYEMRCWAAVGLADYATALEDARKAVALSEGSSVERLIPALETKDWRGSLKRTGLWAFVHASGGFVSMAIKMGWLAKNAPKILLDAAGTKPVIDNRKADVMESIEGEIV